MRRGCAYPGHSHPSNYIKLNWRHKHWCPVFCLSFMSFCVLLLWYQNSVLRSLQSEKSIENVTFYMRLYWNDINYAYLFQGSETVVFCATEYNIEGQAGKFYRDCAEYKSKYPFDKEEEVKLWNVSEEMVKARKPLWRGVQ